MNGNFGGWTSPLDARNWAANNVFFFVSSNNNIRNGEMVLFLSSVEMAKFLLASIWSITCSPNTGVAFVADRLDCIQLTERLNYILDASEFVIRYRMFKHNRCPKNATSSHCSRVLDHTHSSSEDWNLTEHSNHAMRSWHQIVVIIVSAWSSHKNLSQNHASNGHTTHTFCLKHRHIPSDRTEYIY